MIPAWNEEKRLPFALARYTTILEAYSLPFEIIVVADGVTDRTVEVAARFSARGVRTLEFHERLGKGGAVIAGFLSANFDLVGFVDADSPITGVSFAYMLAELSNHDGAIASRWHPLSRHDRNKPLSRLVMSRIWNSMAHLVLGLDVRDTQCGAKMFKRRAVLEVLPKISVTNWAFDACLLFHLKNAGFEVVEVPVNWSDDPDTKVRAEKVVPAMFLSLIGIRLMSIPKIAGRVRPVAVWLYRMFG